VKFEVVEPPVVSTGPVWPKRFLSLVVIFVGSLMVGVAAANRLGRWRPMVGSSSGLAQLTGLPVLAAVGPAFPLRARRLLRREILGVSAAAVCLMVAFVAVLVLSHQGVRLHLPPSLQRLV
jgi:hypothetical protein